MAERMQASLSPSLRERLDTLLDTTDDDRFSALNRIKESTPSPSAVGMRRLLSRLELIEMTGVLPTIQARRPAGLSNESLIACAT